MELRRAVLLLHKGIRNRLLLRNAVGICQDWQLVCGYLAIIPRDLSAAILQYIPDLRVEYTENILVGIEQRYIDFVKQCEPDEHGDADAYISRRKVMLHYGIMLPHGECYLKLFDNSRGGHGRGCGCCRRLYVGSDQLDFIGQVDDMPRYAEYISGIIHFIGGATLNNASQAIGLRYVLPCGLVLAETNAANALLIDPETGTSMYVVRDPNMSEHHYEVDDYGNFTKLSPMAAHNIPDYAEYATIGNAARLGPTRTDFASFYIVD